MYGGGSQVSKYFTKHKINEYGERLAQNYAEKPIIKCEHCWKSITYNPIEGKPTKCDACGHTYGTPIPIITIIPEGAKPSTHNQIRVICGYCGYRAVVWVKKGITKISCPKCKKDDWGVKIYKMNPEGSCNTYEIWEEDSIDIFSKKHKIVTRPKKKFYICPECGYNNYFIIKPPTKCKICKRMFLP